MNKMIKYLWLLLFAFECGCMNHYTAINGADINNLHATEKKCRDMAKKQHELISIEKPKTYNTQVDCYENGDFINCHGRTTSMESPELGLAESVLNLAQLFNQDAYVDQCLKDNGFIIDSSYGKDYGVKGGSGNPESESYKKTSKDDACVVYEDGTYSGQYEGRAVKLSWWNGKMSCTFDD